MRLHNLVRSDAWPSSVTGSATPPALSQARVDATLALALVSIFSSQASPLSRRRRFWKQAITEPKRAEGPIEPWVQVALGADYDEACNAAFAVNGDLVSPSDTIPLLKVAEYRCTLALQQIWIELFTALVSASCGMQITTSKDAASGKPVLPDHGQIGARISHLLRATVPGSPVHTFALLTQGFYAMGMGDTTSARQHAASLFAESKQKGAAAGIASVQTFIQLVLPFVPQDPSQTELAPITDLDVVATAALRWLLVRKQLSKLPALKADRQILDTTLSVRRLFTEQVWHTETSRLEGDAASAFAAAQEQCIDALVSAGRVAAGLPQSPASDSGYSDSSE